MATNVYTLYIIERSKNMFEEYQQVRIKGLNVIGTIIDIHEGRDGVTYYTVENDKEEPINHPDAWNDIRFPQLICAAEQLEHI